MDFDVMKCAHVILIILTIILNEGLECALIAHILDFGWSTVIYQCFNYSRISAMKDLHIKGSDFLITSLGEYTVDGQEQHSL